MSGLFQLVAAFRRDEMGATAIEYALIVGLVGVALIGSLSALNSALWDLLVNGIAARIEAAFVD